MYDLDIKILCRIKITKRTKREKKIFSFSSWYISPYFTNLVILYHMRRASSLTA
jgi:hypothetical protein